MEILLWGNLIHLAHGSMEWWDFGGVTEQSVTPNGWLPPGIPAEK
jgi:hypothetical protein